MESAGDHQRTRHRKSRNGCHKCKSRRVKCDETRPRCQKCVRLDLECTWPFPRHHQHQPRNLAQAPSETHSSAASTSTLPANAETTFGELLCTPSSSSGDLDTEGPRDDLPETRSRRLLEHRLMQNYFFNLVGIFPVPSNPAWTNIFAKTVPSLALKHENLFYTLLAFSATNLLARGSDNRELFDARQSYLVAAMCEQRAMVKTISMDTASPICLAAILILLNTFAMLQERVLEPYTPPLEWLQMGKGAGSILRMSIGYLRKHGDGSNSELLALANSPPQIGTDESYFDPSMRAEFDGILTQDMSSSGDEWNDETRDAYERTLSYVGSIQKSLRRGEPVYVVARRIQAFPMVVPHKFVDFLAEQRPRALLILAHYFATVSQLNSLWWLGGGTDGTEPTAKREVDAILKKLPEEWQGHMIWPLDMVRLS